MLLILFKSVLAFAAPEHYFALVNSSNVVESVIVAEQSFVDKHPIVGKTWVETSADGTVTKNMAGIGRNYDPVKKDFIAPKPRASWVLDSKNVWEPPIPEPADGKTHTWDEAGLQWLPISSTSAVDKIGE